MEKILINFDSSELSIEMLEKLKQTYYNYEIIFSEKMVNNLSDVEILITYNLDEKQLETANKLKWVQSTSSGTNQFPQKVLNDKNIILTSAKGVHKGQMSEYAIMAMIYFSKNMPFYLKAQASKTWTNRAPNAIQTSIEDATLGIVGLGEIGKELARKAKALGMKVIANSYSNKPNEFVDQMVDLNTLFKKSDYIVSILPYTNTTEGLINENYFSLMKATSVFINIGRGSTVNEKDLINALINKKIAGAFLDVFEIEPLSFDSPLWSMENVVITPHMSGLFSKYKDKLIEQFIANKNNYENKMLLQGQVDYNQGY